MPRGIRPSPKENYKWANSVTVNIVGVNSNLQNVLRRSRYPGRSASGMDDRVPKPADGKRIASLQRKYRK